MRDARLVLMRLIVMRCEMLCLGDLGCLAISSRMRRDAIRCSGCDHAHAGRSCNARARGMTTWWMEEVEEGGGGEED